VWAKARGGSSPLIRMKRKPPLAKGVFWSQVGFRDPNVAQTLAVAGLG